MPMLQSAISEAHQPAIARAATNDLWTSIMLYKQKGTTLPEYLDLVIDCWNNTGAYHLASVQQLRAPTFKSNGNGSCDT